MSLLHMMQMRTANRDVQELRELNNLDIRPRDVQVPQDVLEYLLPLLQARLLGLDLCSNNEASRTLKIFEVR